jgi:hypothetical protein
MVTSLAVSPQPVEPVRRPLLWIGYALCLAIGIPWYREPGTLDALIAGFPTWALMSALAALGIAALTLWAVARPWSEGEDD